MTSTPTSWGLLKQPYKQESTNVDQDGHYYRHLAMIFPSRSQLIRDLSLTRTDQMEISKRRGDPQRLGFAYQLGFVRVFQRFPVQQPLEICEELLSLVALQTGIDGGFLGDYASWQQTVSRHQIRIREYLGLRSFGPGPRERLGAIPLRRVVPAGTTSFSTASTSSIAPGSAKEWVLMLYFNTNVGATLTAPDRSASCRKKRAALHP